MSIRKYRWYLIIVTGVVILAGVLIYVYVSGQEKAYQDGTLVQMQYMVEEECA